MAMLSGTVPVTVIWIYSYFKYKNDHYYYLIEFFGESAHSLYEKRLRNLFNVQKILDSRN
ncbi:hypothetical protein [Acinetobacter baumannii]|uniref:hypothetical protein n=1 Tax=Acinetobacter baumannii TaxID=470 RepID=UPI002948E133|nr:hypothetical protein [Acinetobacter baumannii]MDV5263226.1 hypothetical protein [Acinetobacter baumannii]